MPAGAAALPRIPAHTSWEKALELERIGGKVITLPRDEFKSWDA